MRGIFDARSIKVIKNKLVFYTAVIQTRITNLRGVFNYPEFGIITPQTSSIVKMDLPIRTHSHETACKIYEKYLKT